MRLPSELDRKFIEVTAADLPLHCPLPSQQLWNTHPRVFMPIDVQRECRCPYCGTLYRLVGDLGPGGH